MSSCSDSSWRNLLSVIIFSGSHCYRGHKRKRKVSVTRGRGKRTFLRARERAGVSSGHKLSMILFFSSQSSGEGSRDKQAVTLIHSKATLLASWFSVDGPRTLDCSVPLSVSQLTKLSTVDSPL